jgi:membrane protein YdbS with pleckstrin-like domain
MSGLLGRLLDPHVEQYLLSDDDEEIIDEVTKHPVAVLLPMLRLLLAFALFVSALFIDAPLAWLAVPGAFILGVQAVWRIVDEHRDRFVVTNMRAFRVHGIFTQHRATTPMSRILDITVDQPFVGRVFGYGHFIFESAAQDQGLREIRFVPRPDERDRTIQTVIQRAGLRASSPRWNEDEEL